MNNLFLPPIDFSQPPEFNHRPGPFWSLINPNFQKSYVVPDFLTPDECMEVMKLGHAFPMDQSSTGQNGHTGFNDIRKSYNSWIPPCELTHWFFMKLDEVIKRVNKENYEYNLHSIEHIQYTVYDQNYQGKYNTHIDSLATTSSPDSHRKLSFSLQLSNPNDYEGGDLLVYEEGAQPVVVPKQQGLIVFFPSYTLHEVTPVTKGTRISAVSWIHGPRFK